MPDKPRKADAVEVAGAVLELGGLLRSGLDGFLRDADLSVPLADALWALDPARGPLPRRAVAELLHCDASNVTFLADRLEERGLVERVSNAADRRVKALQLTAAGRATRERLERALADGSPLGRLTRSELAQLAELVRKATERV